MPDLILQAPDRLEATEWFAAAKRRATLAGKGRRGGAMPRFRRKHEHARFVCLHNGGRSATLTRTGRRSGIVTITGSNPKQWQGTYPSRWSVQIRVRLSQPVRTYTSVAVNWTTRELVFINPPAALAKKNTGPSAVRSVVGIDLGVAHTIATSDGVFFDAPNTDDLDARIVWHARGMAKARRINNPTKAKTWTPTKGYTRHRKAFSAAHADKTARLDDWRHKVTTALVTDHHLVAVEDLNVKNMTRSARGTLTEPGARVAQKKGLNRSLAQAAFGTLRAMLAYKTDSLITAGHDQHLLAVNPVNTSRRCNQCGHTAKGNRKNQADFRCQACGHTANADTNAASNVLTAALQTWGWTGTGSKSCAASSNARTSSGKLAQDRPPHREVQPLVAGGSCVEPRTTLQTLTR